MTGWHDYGPVRAVNGWIAAAEYFIDGRIVPWGDNPARDGCVMANTKAKTYEEAAARLPEAIRHVERRMREKGIIA